MTGQVDLPVHCWIIPCIHRTIQPQFTAAFTQQETVVGGAIQLSNQNISGQWTHSILVNIDPVTGPIQGSITVIKFIGIELITEVTISAATIISGSPLNSALHNESTIVIEVIPVKLVIASNRDSHAAPGSILTNFVTAQYTALINQ